MGNGIEYLVLAEIDSFHEFFSSIKSGNISEIIEIINTKLNEINALTNGDEAIRNKMLSYAFNKWSDIFDKGEMHRHTRKKPFGYAGDFQIIDWLYTFKTSEDAEGKKFDEIYHQQGASCAVRNRKKYFCKIIDDFNASYINGFSVLDIACGPCRDVLEAAEISSQKGKNIYFHCVDVEEKAISYAKEVCAYVSDNIKIQWTNTNAFKIKITEKYDLVWSAGLFDYLNDRVAIALIKRMWNWTREGGKMIFGNFHSRNAYRNYMEWVLDWHLIHRTDQDLIDLCLKAGIPKECIKVQQEELGINIFCAAAKI